jgi:hypothetical protein
VPPWSDDDGSAERSCPHEERVARFAQTPVNDVVLVTAADDAARGLLRSLGWDPDDGDDRPRREALAAAWLY